MSTFTLKQFSRPDSLKAMRADLLSELLRPYAEYLRSRDSSLDLASSPPSNYEVLATVLMSPIHETPDELIDDLYFVEEMATPTGMEDLHEEIKKLSPVERAPFDLGEEVSPADLAVLVRLRLPALIERKHAERMISARRAFAYFQHPQREAVTEPCIGENELTSLEGGLTSRLEQLNRAGKVKLFCFRRPEALWILARRGELLTRDGAIKWDESTSVVYRPERYDILQMDFKNDLLGVNVAGDNKFIRETYRDLVGLHLFGNIAYFADRANYTLEPLRSLNPEVLAVSDIDGIERIVLTELHTFWEGSGGEWEIRKAKDLLAAFIGRGHEISEHAQLKTASFRVYLPGVRSPRTVTIRTPDRVSYTRDSDAVVIKEWIIRRKFLVREE